MRTVAEVAKLTGVSVRTLHHYDAIGLLKPAVVTEAGYRLYDDRTLERLHTILLFRQLRFPLKEIREILDSPNFDPREALTEQIALLEMQKAQLEALIAHARTIQQTGVIPMNFAPYDTGKLDEYAAEAKRRWGGTEAYRESQEKSKGKSKQELQQTGEQLMDIFRALGAIRHTDPGSPEAQKLVKQLQDFITAHYYRCTDQILCGLGQLYIAGDEMTENIEKAGGPGTAEFANRAIRIHCGE